MFFALGSINDSARVTDLRFVKGIGPAKAAQLHAAGLSTVFDLLHALPKCLGAPPPWCDTGPLPDSEVRVSARVLRVRPQFMRGRGMSIEVALERADGLAFTARFWNAGYLRRHLLPGEWYAWSGRASAGKLAQPAFTHQPTGSVTERPPDAGVRVAYRLPEGFGERSYLQLIERLFTTHLDAISDPAERLPSTDYHAVLRRAHSPASDADFSAARRALAERECLALAFALQSRRALVTGETGRAWPWDDDTDARAQARLPFALTAEQQRVLTEIRGDLRAPAPMYRLLHGEVGSVKTAVALIAMLAIIATREKSAARGQTALLVPTGILAQQHHRFITRCLDGTRVRVGLLTGATPMDERAALLSALADGTLHMLIGTHALLEDDVRFAALGLLVIDEQHRFGVAQRATLIERARAQQGWRPDLLLLTATPIPRTLALTVFGDLAVSQLRERPPGRATVTTEVREFRRLAQLDDELRRELARDGRVFVICARREETTDKTDAPALMDVESVADHCRSVVGDARVAVVHGGLAEALKNAALNAFADGTRPVLVATTVVEVGIDVASATLLMVLDADCFGLAQLHQLRGRVGRGERPGRCVLFHQRGEAPERLTLLTRTDDGLAIAEADLAARGAGELLGDRQHGTLALRIADLATDLDILQRAHADARQALTNGQTMPAGLAQLLPGLMPMSGATALAGG